MLTNQSQIAISKSFGNNPFKVITFIKLLIILWNN